MEGQAFAEKLQGLNLNMEEIGAKPLQSGAKSPTKSQKMMAEKRISVEPYNFPSASGPGGLVAMLNGLKRIRRDRSKSFIKPEDDASIELQEKSVYFDAHSTLPLLDDEETFATSRTLPDDLSINGTQKKAKKAMETEADRR